MAILLVIAAAGATAGPAVGDAAAATSRTTSYYEYSAAPRALFLEGKAAGIAAAQGIVILDFGRPAFDGSSDGTLGYGGRFLSLTSVAASVESFISGYFSYAPGYTTLDVAIGTNDSCGAGQPCGGTICGCPDEPPSYVDWGRALAATVKSVGSWVRGLKVEDGFTDEVRVVAGDDAEPAYDPGYANTYGLLEGYAQAVGGSYPAMVDYGSADPHYWTEAQLLQVAYGFPPDVPMPEVYTASEASEWAELLHYGETQRHETVVIYGVLAAGRGSNDPETAYDEMLGAAADVTGQRRISWLSTITHDRVRDGGTPSTG